MNGKKAKLQRKHAEFIGKGQGYLRALRKKEKLSKQTFDSKSTTPPIGTKPTPTATGPKKRNQPDYGPPIDLRPVHNAKATARMALATTVEPPIDWFEKAQKLLRIQGLAQRIGKMELMRKLNELRLI